MKSLHCALAVINVCIGVLYAFSDGPYVHSEGDVISSRDLLSAGAEGGFIIALALISFLASAIAPFVSNLKSAALLAVYVTNYVFYATLLMLAHIDTPLFDSVRLGDWPLLFGLLVPAIMLIFYAFTYRAKNSSTAKA